MENIIGLVKQYTLHSFILIINKNNSVAPAAVEINILDPFLSFQDLLSKICK